MTDEPESFYMADGDCAKTKHDALTLVEAVTKAADSSNRTKLLALFHAVLVGRRKVKSFESHLVTLS